MYIKLFAKEISLSKFHTPSAVPSWHHLLVAGARYYSFLQNIPISRGHTKPSVLWEPRGFAQRYSGKDMKLIILFHLLPKLRICRAVPPFLYAFMIYTGRNLPSYQMSIVFNVSSRRKIFKETFPSVNMI